MSSNDFIDQFSVCTFNILAPCYKRLSSESDRESQYQSIWKERHLAIINLLESLDIDIICLQEYWLDSNSFCDLYQSHFSSNYSYYYVQRTCRLDDGLAIFIKKKSFQVIDKYDLLLHDIGNRVGLLLNLQINGKCLLLINVHLTFPHDSFDKELRLTQMRKFLELINEYKMKTNLSDKCSIILCGDFNDSSDNDPVYQLIQKEFKSSYFIINRHEPKVTHLTHRNEQLGVDFIFYQSNLFKPISSLLIPEHCDQNNWNDQTNWTLSDHRPVLTTFQFINNQS